MLFSKAKGHKVVSTSSADTVGKVDGFVVDPATRSVVALLLKKTDAGSVLTWSAMSAFGDDAVTVSGADVIGEADERIGVLADKHHRVLGKRVLTSAGDDLGEVEDVEFDTDSGEVTALHLKSQQIVGTRLRGVGTYAVVVDVADRPASSKSPASPTPPPPPPVADAPPPPPSTGTEPPPPPLD